LKRRCAPEVWGISAICPYPVGTKSRQRPQGAWASRPQSPLPVGGTPTLLEPRAATLPRSGSRNGFRWLLTGHRTSSSKFFQNSATFRSPTSALRFLFSLRAPASPREIPFLFPIRVHLPSFAAPKTQKTLTPKLQPAGTPPSKFFQNSATFRSPPW
jgi:hypothetical protein